IVTPPVTQVDPAQERDIFTITRVSDDNQLLMMRARGTHPLIQEDQSPGVIHLVGELHVMLEVETRGLGMRPPNETAHRDPAFREICQEGRELDTLDEELVWVPPPVGEVHGVAALRVTKRAVQLLEVRSSVHDDIYLVVDRERSPISAPSVELGGGVAPI